MQQRTPLESKLLRADWGVIISLFISIATAVFTIGVIYGTVENNTRRLSIIENKTDAMETTVARIDANVSFLTERAREDRAVKLSRTG